MARFSLQGPARRLALATGAMIAVFALAFSMAAPLAGTADACPPGNPTGIC